MLENKVPERAVMDELEIKEKYLASIVSQLKESALDFCSDDQREWLIHSLKESRSLDKIVSTLRHIDGGQIFILKKLLEIDSSIKWYRGGNLTQWRDTIGTVELEYYSEDQLNTIIFDGGANGAFSRKELAYGFLKLTPRQNPIIYEISLEALIDGLRNKQIFLVAEDYYDIRITSNPGSSNSNTDYLEFCKKYLNYEEIGNI